MGSSSDQKEQRYFLYKHDRKNLLFYRTSTGGWDADFAKAMLWVDFDFVLKKAKECSEWKVQDHPESFTLVIGRADVEIDPFFFPHVVKHNAQ